MCPVLSLANRAFLALLGTLLAFTSLPTQAEELQFDLTGTAFTPDNNSFPGVGPIDISFVLDTQSGTAPVLTYGNLRPELGGPSSCLQHFGVMNAAVSDMTITLNGQSLFSGNALASYGGDSVAGSCAPGKFFAGMIFNNGLGWAFDPEPSISQTALAASSDPLATLLLGFRWGPDAANPGSGRFNELNLDFAHLVVSDVGPSPASVPEPGTLGLLMLGFAGVVLCGRKRISASLVVALLPALAQASTVEFNFTGQVFTLDYPNAPQNVWNGPGPMPSGFQMTFLVDTLAPGNSWQSTFMNCPDGPCVNTISAVLAATNFNVTLGGQLIEQGGTGRFGFSSGDRLSDGLNGLFIGGVFFAEGLSSSFIGVPDFGLGNGSQSALLSSTDPLGTLLDGSAYVSDGGDITYFNYGDSRLLVQVAGRAATVPEPDALTLFAAGGLGLLLFRRRRTGQQAVTGRIV